MRGTWTFAGFGLAVWRRQLLDAWRSVVVVAAIALAGALFVSSAPRVLEIATVDDLRETLATATPEERNIRFDTRTEIGAGAPGVPFSNIEWIGGQLRDESIPPSVLELVADEQWVFDTPQFVVGTYPDLALPRHPPTFRFRQQSEIESHLELVEGTLPLAREPELRLEGSDCPEEFDDLATFEPVEDQDCALVEIPIFETAITQATAVEFGFALERRDLVVGDRFMMRPDQTNLGFRGSLVSLGELRFIVEVSGIIELDPADDPYWYGDILLHRPRVRENNDFEFVFAAGLLGPDQYRPFRAAAPGVGLDFSWRYLVDADLVEDTDSEELLVDLEKITSDSADVVTRLPELLDEHIAQRRLTLQVWSMVGLALAAAAVASLATVAHADSVRRRAVTDLQLGRGASAGQLRRQELLSALVVVVIPAAIGAALAALSFSGSSAADSVAAAALFAATGVMVVVGVAGLGVVSRARRIVARAALVVAAVGVVALLRRRDSGVDEAATGELDPTLMLAPVLLIAVVAVIGTDLLGPVARAVSRWTGRGRGPVWFVGVRRIAATARTLRGPLLTVVIAVALSILATVIGSSIDAGQDAAARQRVGAEVRLETSLPEIPLPADLIDAAAEADEDALFAAALAFQRFEGPRGGFVADVLAIDRPDAILDPEAPAPATLVGAWDAPHLPDVGEEFDLELTAYVVPMEVTERVDRFPGVRDGVPTVVVDRAALALFSTDRIATPDIVFIDDESVLDGLVATADGRPGVAFTTRVGEVERLAGDPLSTWTRRGLRLAAAAGLLLAVVAAVAATVVHERDRRRDLGVVTILGGTRADAVRVALAELAPTYGVAALLGVSAGVFAARVLGPNLSFEAFSDGAVSAGVVVEWSALAGVVLAVALALGLVLVVAARAIRRLDHAKILREGNR